MRNGSSLWQELQQTHLGALTEYSTWVPCLSAIQCMEYMSNNLFPNNTQKGFATTLRRVILSNNTVVLLTRPTAYHTPGTMGNRLDEANPPWPPGDTEKRLVFVDIPIPNQTGSFYIGTFIRDPAMDRFLTTNEIYKLSKELQTELVNLWVPADATRTQRHNALQDLRAGMLSVPCVVLKRIDEEFADNIDSRLLDAIRRDRPSLGRLDLDATGCIYPEDAWKRHRHELEERVVGREFEVDVARSRRWEVEEKCHILATEIASFRTLPGLTESNDPTSEPETPSTKKRRREGLESFSNVPMLPTRAIVTGGSATVLKSSASHLTPLLLPNPTDAVPEPSNLTSQPLEENLGHFQTYRDLAPIPRALTNGVPVALISCGYNPLLLAKSLRTGIPPSAAQPPSSGPVRKSIIVQSWRIIWLDKPTSRYHRSRALLLQNPVSDDHIWDPITLSSSEKWKDGHFKALLEPFKLDPYDGTTWHGIYCRVPLKEDIQFISQGDLFDLPLDTKVSLARAVPEDLRETTKNLSSGSTSSPSSLDEAVWQHVIESGRMKIPVVLITFHDIGVESLCAARLSRQGPENLGTLFAADPDGLPLMPRIGHEKLLERLAAADNHIEVEEADLRDITNLLNQLTIERETILDDLSHAKGSSLKKVRFEDVEDEPPNVSTLPASSQPTSNSLSIEHGSSASTFSAQSPPSPHSTSKVTVPTIERLDHEISTSKVV